MASSVFRILVLGMHSCLSSTQRSLARTGIMALVIYQVNPVKPGIGSLGSHFPSGGYHGFACRSGYHSPPTSVTFRFLRRVCLTDPRIQCKDSAISGDLICLDISACCGCAEVSWAARDRVYISGSWKNFQGRENLPGRRSGSRGGGRLSQVLN